jgi:hypothetical protein
MKTLIRLILILGLFGTVAVAVQPASNEVNANAPARAEKNYWLTIKSGIRHNSKCRYFHNSNGRPCTKDEGRACKICGG